MCGCCFFLEEVGRRPQSCSALRELEVRYVRGGDCPYELETMQVVTDAVEKPFAAAEERRHKAYYHLVDEVGGEVLLCRLRSAGEGYILTASRSARLLERRFDTVGDKGECGSAFKFERLALVTCEYEYRVMVWRIDSPPTLPRFFGVPGARMAAEHVASHHGGSNVGQRLLYDDGTFVDLATFEALHLPPRFERKHPLVQPHATDPERVVHALAGTGDKPVKRHRDSEAQLWRGHVLAPSEIWLRARLAHHLTGARKRARSRRASSRGKSHLISGPRRNSHRRPD